MFISSKTYLQYPTKIISLVPSISELLYDLNLETETIAITKFCIYPSVWFKSKEKIGGTKNINIQKIISLSPDLIICNKEENLKEEIEEIAKLFPVYLTDVNSYESALQMIKEVGEITKRKKQAENIINRIEKTFQKETGLNLQYKKAAYLIWKEPYMTVGGDTFISDMLQKIGLVNMFSEEKRYPQITIKELQHAEPHIILLSSEPYPFKEKHLTEFKKHFEKTKILLADGEMFSWYGSRMLLMPEYFKKLLLEIEKNDN